MVFSQTTITFLNQGQMTIVPWKFLKNFKKVIMTMTDNKQHKSGNSCQASSSICPIIFRLFIKFLMPGSNDTSILTFF
jgi:hypothetical protein